jgi:POT family proton-dependent oligopeptide transporter
MTRASSEHGNISFQPNKFDWRYWMCAWVETLERLAYYTIRPVAAIYIMQVDDPGGLHLRADDRALIFMLWAFVQSVLPTCTGGLADRYGYKRTLRAALCINAMGYLLMAFLRTKYGYLAGVLVLASGTAFFKPGLQGTMAHLLTKETSSLGWGIFYFIVNVGALIGHLFSPFILGDHQPENWRNMYLVCAGFTFVNLVSLIRFPNIPSGVSTREGPILVLTRTIRNVLEPRLLAWLLIMSCFWMMMFQLWDSQPNFIEDWVGSASVAQYCPVKGWVETGADGLLRIKQQVILSLNAAMIIVLVVPVSWIVRHMRTLSAMLGGMFFCTAGILVAGLTNSAWPLLGGIVLFSLGEMLTGPKTAEYLGLIAPANKKGLYLGYANIPMGLGQLVGAGIAGWLYQNYGEKATLALRYLMENTPLGNGKTWDGRVDSLAAVLGVTREEAFDRLQSVLGKSGSDATRILWDTYHPQYYVWIPFAVIGMIAMVALAVFGRMARRWSDMNA